MMRLLLKVLVISTSLMVSACKASSVIPIQTWNTQNGVKVLFDQSTQLPMLDVRVVFAAGSSRDGQQYGLANLTADALDVGAGQLSADQIADNFANVGAEYGASANQDMTVLSLRSLTQAQYLDPALQTFITVMTKPTFPANEIARLEKQQLIGIQMSMQDPGTVAQMKFLQAMYGNTPYGHMVMGQADTVAKLSPQDFMNFYKQYYVANNALIVLVGDISKPQAEKIANQLSQGLAQGQAAPPIPAVPFKAAGQVIRVPFNSEQTTILMGEPGIQRGNPLFFPLSLGNYTLGGGSLVSRLFVQVRSQSGFAYSISSRFVSQQAPGPFVIMAQTRNEKASAALVQINQVVQNFVSHGPTQAELDAAKQNLIGGFPLMLSGNANIADILTSLGFYKLPLNYLDTYRQKLQDTTLAQVQQAINQTLHPNAMLTVIVGGANS
ncbi:MAG: peptidase domain protein [Gammaproteobacteria bacterium]|jgi:zinc protease|nr:peptidase domain protein [Gammaproteobacteria bacterium]